MLSCTFAGHRKIYAPDFRAKLRDALERLLVVDDSFVFYNGGRGDFDRLAASEIANAKREYPRLVIRHCLVIPYLCSDSVLRKAISYDFDEIIFPSALDNVHYKAAIRKRNEWMVDHSDYLIAGVVKNSGGAYATLSYARANGKSIILLSNGS